MKRYYFDLDGVLMKYDRTAYEQREGQQPIWLTKNGHYFRTLEPDMWVLELLYNLIGYTRTHTNAGGTHDEVKILTSVVYGEMFNEHFHDKIIRTLEVIPALSVEDILISVGNKKDCVEFVTDHMINADDILFDDYNPNLNIWREAGGTAWKYCNGLNNPASFDGVCFGPDFDTVEATLQQILAI